MLHSTHSSAAGIRYHFKSLAEDSELDPKLLRRYVVRRLAHLLDVSLTRFVQHEVACSK